MSVERRVKPRPVSIEDRADGVKTISGYAAVFYDPSESGTEYELWDNCVERVLPSAFSRAIAEGQDVTCLFNHDSDALIGRTKNKTCRLSVDSIGLRYEADLPGTTTANDCAILVARGDIQGSSFSFSTKSVRWDTLPDGTEVRNLVDVDLYDVGPVTSPAYAATTTSARDSKTQLIAERNEMECRNRDIANSKDRERQIDADRVSVAVARAKVGLTN